MTAEKEVQLLAKRVNERLRRVENEHLTKVSSMYKKLVSAKDRPENGFFTGSNAPRVTGSTAGKSAGQIAEMRDTYVNILNELSIKDIKNQVREYAQNNDISYNESLVRMSNNRLFEQLIETFSQFLDSTTIQEIVQEYDSTPDYDQAYNDIMNQYAQEFYNRDPDSAKDLAREWGQMNGIPQKPGEDPDEYAERILEDYLDVVTEYYNDDFDNSEGRDF